MTVKYKDIEYNIGRQQGNYTLNIPALKEFRTFSIKQFTIGVIHTKAIEIINNNGKTNQKGN